MKKHKQDAETTDLSGQALPDEEITRYLSTEPVKDVTSALV